MPAPVPLAQTLDKRAGAAVAGGLVPGLSVALVERTAPTWEAAYGVTDRTSPTPVEASTVFEGASLSKPLVAYGALLLAQDGTLELDRPMDSYLPEPYLPHEPAAAVITARMALGHTTGYPNWRPAEQLSLVRPPGSQFGYSGEGYVQLGCVIEHLTHQPLGAFLSERVLQPLGIADSSFTWSPAFEHRVARGHTPTGEAVPKEKPTEALAPSSLHTTVTDFARFLAAMLNPAHAAPLDSDGVHAMLTPHVQLSGPLAWGLGWGLDDSAAGDRVFWQWGDNNGYKAFAAGSASAGVGIVVLTNGANGLDAAKPLVQTILPTLEAPFDAAPDLGRYTQGHSTPASGETTLTDQGADL